jgi:hypothetical protein
VLAAANINMNQYLQRGPLDRVPLCLMICPVIGLSHISSFASGPIFNGLLNDKDAEIPR